MKFDNKKWNNLSAAIIVVAINLISAAIGFLPWWFFVVPVISFGILISLKEWPVASFVVGFFAGFTIWITFNTYYNLIYSGRILINIANLLSVNITIIILISGVIGGLLNGIAFYTGKCMFASEPALNEDFE